MLKITSTNAMEPVDEEENIPLLSGGMNRGLSVEHVQSLETPPFWRKLE